MTDVSEPEDENSSDENYDYLYNARPDCKHEIILPPGGGVKCKHCPGWFCY